MKTKEEKIGMAFVYTSCVGFITFLTILIIQTFFVKDMSKTFEVIGLIGGMLFMMPFFLAQFFGPSGLINGFRDIPLLGKIMFYVVVFPSANVWMISISDTLFNFLPNLHEARIQGASAIELNILREQWAIEAWTTVAVIYILLVGSGIVFKAIFGNKLRVA